MEERADHQGTTAISWALLGTGSFVTGPTGPAWHHSAVSIWQGTRHERALSSWADRAPRQRASSTRQPEQSRSGCVKLVF